MKKRILALALAGTTAFSVFGAAISANAAAPSGVPVISAHVLSSNDYYKEYSPVADKIVVTTDTTNATAATYQYYNWFTGQMVTTDKATLDSYLLRIWEIKDNYNTFYPVKTTAWGCYYVNTDNDKIIGVQKDQPESGSVVEGVDKVTKELGISKDATGDYIIDGVYADSTSGNFKKFDSVAEAVDYLKANSTLTDAYKVVYVHKTEPASAGETRFTSTADFNAKVVYKNATDYINNSDLIKVIDGTAAETTVEGVTVGDGAVDWTKWTVNGSTSADTTIYPWTVDTHYTVGDGAIQVDVNEAVSNPTVYLFDFLPFNGTNYSSSGVASAYNNYVAAYKADQANHTTATAEALAKAESELVKYMGGITWDAETGDGTSYGIRAEVVDKYEEFLSELVLLRRYGDPVVSKTDFKDEYDDQYVSGYFYDPYTGFTTTKWTTDVYHLSELLDDIYESSLPTGNSALPYEYLTMNTSELMYLMQQYDKYVGYIDKAEVSNDEWGDLLVSILENVSEDDFTTTAAYKSFARTAEDAIDAYTYATTSSLVKAAERKMYDVIVGSYSKTSSVTDAKAELDATVGSLYFNAKSIPSEYMTEGMKTGNATLTNYAYIAAVTTKPTFALDPNSNIVLETSSITTTGYYSLYPAADYKQTNNTAAQFPGNDKNDTSYNVDVTDEYEWFLNVYELARNASGSKVSGIVSAVNDALVSAVDNLAVTNAATATANSALDEMIEYYEEELDFYVTGNGVNEDDFNETYYDAYTKALEIAESAEGAYQVAFARRMVAVAGEALTYQGAQTTVTKAMINDLNTAVTSGKTALEAIKNSADYNAAQVTALNKAITQAEEIVAIYNGKLSASTNVVNHAARNGVGDKDAIVASDITGAIDAIDAAINYSEIIMGWSKNDAGKWVYGTEEGYLNDGWHKIDNIWYYFNTDNTAKQSEWFQENGKWYWLNSNCGAAYGWAKVDGKWYYFNGDNSMRTGWVKVEGNWYYLASSGKMVTGWCEVDGKWYYFSKKENALGQMEYNTTIDGYKLGADGAWIK